MEIYNEKQKTEESMSSKITSSDDTLSLMQSDLQNIKIQLDKKYKINKKLLTDCQSLVFNIENKSNYINNIEKEFNTCRDSNNQLKEEKKNFNNIINELSNLKTIQIKEIENLINLSDNLNVKLEQKHKLISDLEAERIKYNSMDNEIQITNQEKNYIIQNNDAAINYYQKQLNDNNNVFIRKNESIQLLENQYKELQIELEELCKKNKMIMQKKFLNEKNFRELLENMENKEKQINNFVEYLDSIDDNKKYLYNYNKEMYNKLEKLQNHFYELTEQNNKLMQKLEYYKQCEDSINNYLQNKINLNQQLKNDQAFVDRILGNDEGLEHDRNLDLKGISDNNINEKISNMNENIFQNENYCNDSNNNEERL